MTGAVWYATGYLYSPYSAAEQPSALRGPAEEVVLARLVFAALPVVLQAVARCGWFISCLGLSDMPIPTPIAYFPPQSTRFWRFWGVFALRATAASKRLSQSPGRHGIGTSWLQLVAVVPGAVWYATGYLHSLYTAAEHSISPLQQQATACPWHPAAATDERIERLPVMLQAVARCGWFTSCLGLSDMPIPTPIAYFPPQSTRYYWRFGFFLPSMRPRHRNGSLSRPAGMGSAPAGCS